MRQIRSSVTGSSLLGIARPIGKGVRMDLLYVSFARTRLCEIRLIKNNDVDGIHVISSVVVILYVPLLHIVLVPDHSRCTD